MHCLFKKKNIVHTWISSHYFCFLLQITPCPPFLLSLNQIFYKFLMCSGLIELEIWLLFPLLYCNPLFHFCRTADCVFKSWYLLIHFGEWVDIAAEQLLTSDLEVSDDLLWLLAFYYNPCNENQSRDRTMVGCKWK